MLFCTIIVTNAVDTTDEDIDSPLVSYLLAKVQRLEAKMMSKEIKVSTTREVEEWYDSNDTSEDHKKLCTSVKCYIRWGNTTCPYGANTLYKGTAVGGHYSHKGAQSNLMCLQENPMPYSYNQVWDILLTQWGIVVVEPLIMHTAETCLVLYVKQLDGVIK